MKNKLFPPIEAILSHLDMHSIAEERKRNLQDLIDYIQLKVNEKQEIRLNFICTHNSRRSHMAQLWGQTIAAYFHINNVFCYSGGTEATALFPMTAKTMETHGFQVRTLSAGQNPVYSIKFAENAHPLIGFSKTYDDHFNPKSRYAAVMTCSQADVDCPFVVSAEKRISITFDDPKLFDNTPQQAEKYVERSMQIATELFYVFSQIQKR